MTGESPATGVIKENIRWDLDLEREFKGPRQTGFAFVIDVCDGIPRLALYLMKLCYSTSTTLDRQPPAELLGEAVAGRHGNMPGDNLYLVNNDVRLWIEENLLAR